VTTLFAPDDNFVTAAMFARYFTDLIAPNVHSLRVLELPNSRDPSLFALGDSPSSDSDDTAVVTKTIIDSTMERLCAVGKLESLIVPLGCPALSFAQWSRFGRSVHTLNGVEIEDPFTGPTGVTFVALAAAFPHLRSLSIFIREGASLKGFYRRLLPKLESFTVKGQWPNGSSRADDGNVGRGRGRGGGAPAGRGGRGGGVMRPPPPCDNGDDNDVEFVIDTERPLLTLRAYDFTGPLPPPIVARMWTVTSLHLPRDPVERLVAATIPPCSVVGGTTSTTVLGPLSQVRGLTLYHCEGPTRGLNGEDHWLLPVLRAAPSLTDLTFVGPCAPLPPPPAPHTLERHVNGADDSVKELSPPTGRFLSRKLRRISYGCTFADAEQLPPGYAAQLRATYFPRLVVVEG
jgi:hypothetical protein